MVVGIVVVVAVAVAVVVVQVVVVGVVVIEAAEYYSVYSLCCSASDTVGGSVGRSKEILNHLCR